MFTESVRGKIQNSSGGREEVVIAENEHCAPGTYEVRLFGVTKCIKIGDKFIKILDPSASSRGDSKLSQSTPVPHSPLTQANVSLSTSMQVQRTPSKDTSPDRFAPAARNDASKSSPSQGHYRALYMPFNSPAPWHERLFVAMSVLSVPLFALGTFAWAVVFTLQAWFVFIFLAIRIGMFYYWRYPIQPKDLAGFLASAYYLLTFSFTPPLGPSISHASSLILYFAYQGFLIYQEVQFYRSSPTTWPGISLRSFFR